MARPKGSKNKKKQSKGLGDTIAKITEATGIDKVVKAVAGDDCGCDERKAKLNKLIPYRLKVKECLTDKQREWFKEFSERRTLTIASKDIDKIETIYSHLFNCKYKVCRTCPTSGRELIKIIDIIEKIYNESERE